MVAKDLKKLLMFDILRFEYINKDMIEIIFKLLPVYQDVTSLLKDYQELL